MVGRWERVWLTSVPWIWYLNQCKPLYDPVKLPVSTWLIGYPSILQHCCSCPASVQEGEWLLSDNSHPWGGQDQVWHQTGWDLALYDAGVIRLQACETLLTSFFPRSWPLWWRNWESLALLRWDMTSQSWPCQTPTTFIKLLAGLDTKDQSCPSWFVDKSGEKLSQNIAIFFLMLNIKRFIDMANCRYPRG